MKEQDSDLVSNLQCRVRNRFTTDVVLQEFSVERAPPLVTREAFIRAGQEIYLRAHTGQYIHVNRTSVHAQFSDHGSHDLALGWHWSQGVLTPNATETHIVEPWQRLQIQNYQGTDAPLVPSSLVSSSKARINTLLYRYSSSFSLSRDEK